MRLATFLALALLFSAALFAHSFFPANQSATQPAVAPFLQTHPDIRGSDREPMVTRAYIEVVPLDLVAERNQQLKTLRNRITQLEIEDLKSASAKPDMREPLARHVEAMNALLEYIDRTQTDQGKSSTAVEVKRHLNEIEGKMTCEACHTGVVARNVTLATRSGK